MTGKYAQTAAVPRQSVASGPSMRQPSRPGKPGVAAAPRQGSAARPSVGASGSKPAAAPAKARKKRSWPIVELVLFLLVVKISAGAYYILSSPKEAQVAKPAASVADSASMAVAKAVNPETGAESAPQPTTAPKSTSMVDGYLAAAAGAVSPAVAQAAAPIAVVPASSVSAVSAGAFMVLGQSASAEAAAQNNPTIPLPPGGDDLLTPAAQLPPPSSAASPGGTDVAPLPPDGSAANSQSLRAREQDLARKEAMLATKEEALSSLESELNRQLAATEASRGEMEAMVRRNEAILTEMKALREQQKSEEELQKDARIEHLVIAYGGMKPEQAGNLVNSLDDEVAVSILSAMPGRKAGQILAFVNPDKAARLTKAISERRIDPNLLLADQPDANL